MNTVEKIKKICKERNIPISRLEKECGFSNAYIGQLKKGTIPHDRLLKICAYLNIPIEYFDDDMYAQVINPSNTLADSHTGIDAIQKVPSDITFARNGQMGIYLSNDEEENLVRRLCKGDLVLYHELKDYYGNVYDIRTMFMEIISLEKQLEKAKQRLKYFGEMISMNDLGDIAPFPNYPDVTFEEIRKYVKENPSEYKGEEETAKLLHEMKKVTLDGAPSSEQIDNIVPFPQYPTVTDKDIDEFAARNAKKKFSREEIAKMLYEMKEED